MIKANVTCSDLGFCVGGGGRLLENSLTMFFSLSSTYFIVYRGCQIVFEWFYFRGNYFSKVSEGVHYFSRGSIFFPGGSTILQGGGVQLFPGWGGGAI